MNTRPPLGRAVSLLVIAAALISMRRLGLLHLDEWGAATERLWDFATSLFPPHADVMPTLTRAMGETIEMAFVGTLLGFLIALPLAFFATSTLFGPAVSTPARLVIGAVRTVPSLLWGVVFVVGFGLGPAAGALGIALYSVGYLAKLQYESFEAVDAEVLEAVRGVGGNRLQLFNYAVLPESSNAVISQLLFMFEYNIRASSIMGFVGAGGIGYYMLGYLQLLQYENLLTALLITFVVVMAIDYASMRIRSVVLAPAAPRGRAPVLAGLIP